MNTDKVTRFEVIDEAGRILVKYGIRIDFVSLQDDERTLKIFIHSIENEVGNAKS